jgi:plastocyanin
MHSSFVRASARPSLLLALATALGLLVAACAQSAPATPAATNQVDLPRSYRFAPADIVVSAGTTVTWTNNDNFTHSVRFLEDGGEPLMMKPGEHVTHEFDAPGLFRYDCSLHPNDMKGTILVTTGSG